MVKRLSFESLESRELFSVAPITVEAELMQLSGFRPHYRPNGGAYISTGYDFFGVASTTITITEAGNYSLSALVKAIDSDRNELAFSIDSGSQQNWSFPIAGGFRTYTWPAPIALSVGSHTIQWFGIDGGTRLDKFTFTQASTGTLDPNKTPGQNFDLSRWKLDIPINNQGGTTGTGQTIYQPALATYESPYFQTAADGAMQFYAPVIGAKTSSGTSYTRSELREMNAAGDDEIAWTVAQGGTMTAEVKVEQLPVAEAGKLARVIIGQIHGPDDELCRLYYDQNGRLTYVNDKSTGGQELTHVLVNSAGVASSIPLGAKFSYLIQAAAGRLTVTVTYNGNVYTFGETITSFWTGKGCYFKAGAYNAVGAPGSGAGTLGTGASRVSFYALNVSHA